MHVASGMLCVGYTIGFLCAHRRGSIAFVGPAQQTRSLGSVLTGLLGDRELGTMSLCVARAFAQGPGGCAD